MGTECLPANSFGVFENSWIKIQILIGFKKEEKFYFFILFSLANVIGRWLRKRYRIKKIQRTIIKKGSSTCWWGVKFESAYYCWIFFYFILFQFCRMDEQFMNSVFEESFYFFFFYFWKTLHFCICRNYVLVFLLEIGAFYFLFTCFLSFWFEIVR